MGVYERWILASLLDLSMRNQLLDHYRQRRSRRREAWFLRLASGRA